MAGNNFFTDLFDISVREQIALALCNSASDSFFLLSGPPQFSKLGENPISLFNGATDVTTVSEGNGLTRLCPLLFSQQFTDYEPKTPDPLLYSLGTSNSVVAPSSGVTTQKQISVQAAAYVTRDPWALNNKANDTYIQSGSAAAFQPLDQRWNMLKRLYFWLLNDPNYVEYFSNSDAPGSASDKSYIGDESQKPWAVAPDTNAPWGNFAKSDVYKIPFGLMAVVATKDRVPLKITYYEGCLLQNLIGAELNASLNAPVTYAGTSGFTCTFARRKTFSDQECMSIAGNEGTDEVLSSGTNGLFSAILTDYLGTANGTE